MISVSIYKLKDIDDIDKVAQLIQSTGYREEVVNVAGWPEAEKLEKRIVQNTKESFSIGESENLQYILATASIERAKWRKNWFDSQGILLGKNDRILKYHTNILFFTHKSITYVIFFTQNESIFKAFKKDIFIEEWGALEDADTYQLEDDLLYWLVYRNMKCNGLIKNDGFYLTNISYYVGSAIESTHTIKSSGARVCNLLGTMAHILQDEPFELLGITVVIDGENYSFTLYLTGETKINENDYNGSLFENLGGLDLLTNLCLVIYIKILPALVAEYKEHKDKGFWSKQIRDEFSKENGINLLRRIIPMLGLPTNKTIGEILCVDIKNAVEEVAVSVSIDTSDDT